MKFKNVSVLVLFSILAAVSVSGALITQIILIPWEHLLFNYLEHGNKHPT